MGCPGEHWEKIYGLRTWDSLSQKDGRAKDRREVRVGGQNIKDLHCRDCSGRGYKGNAKTLK